jgi:S-adenosyl-L-methionine hydrolase (adenosine-forming)
MIVLFTDFGLHGPYIGQMRAVLHQMAPGIPVIDLFADAPVGNCRASAYLLAAYAVWFPAGTVFLCVVDPGVGGARPAIILEADGKWYVGPRQWLVRAGPAACRNERTASTSPGIRSASRRAFTDATCLHRSRPCWRAARRHPAGCARTTRIARRTGQTTFPIVYIDHFGNAMTGLRAAMLPPNARLAAAGRILERAIRSPACQNGLPSRYAAPERWPSYFLVRQRCFSLASQVPQRPAPPKPSQGRSEARPAERGAERRFEVFGGLLVGRSDLYEEPGVKSKNGEPVVNRVLTIMLADEY